MERRDRLRKLLATMDEDAALELQASREEQQQQQAALGGDAPSTAKVFYTEGSDALKQARFEVQSLSWPCMDLGCCHDGMQLWHTCQADAHASAMHTEAQEYAHHVMYH